MSSNIDPGPHRVQGGTTDRSARRSDRVCRGESFYENVGILSRLLAGEHNAARERIAMGAAAAGEFLCFIEHHHLAWYLTSLLDSSGLRSVFAPDDVGRLERAVEARQLKQEALVDELALLWSRLGERGIDVTLLKGAYLAERFFGDARKRGFVDFDLLVRSEQLPDLERVLEELGYTRQSRVLLSRALTRRCTHGFDYVRGGFRLDAHWSLGAHISYRIDYDRIWNECGVFQLNGIEMKVLSDNDALFFHLVSFFEDIERGAARLRSLVDVYAMLSELDMRIDWPVFWEQRRVERTARVCRAVLGTFFALFDAEERFPRVAGTVASATRQVRNRAKHQTAALLKVSGAAIRNKSWTMRFYECPVAVSLAWWFFSLPFRLAVYRPVRYVSR